MVVHGRPKTPKNRSFFGVTQPQGSHSPYILGDTTRPGHVTYALVWSKSDQRRLWKTLHKQTNRQTDRHYENNGHLAVNQEREWAERAYADVDFALWDEQHLDGRDEVLAEVRYVHVALVVRVVVVPHVHRVAETRP